MGEGWAGAGALSWLVILDWTGLFLTGGWAVAGGSKVTVQEVLSWLFRGRPVEDGSAVDWGGWWGAALFWMLVSWRWVGSVLF